MTNGKPTDSATGGRTAVSAPTLNDSFAHKPWLLALILAVATLVAYFPALHGGFIWDDDDHLTANPAMTAPDGLRMIWSSLAVSRYYPLTLTTFWVQRRLWGLNPMPFHLINIALHAINGVLVFCVLRRLRIPAAWLVAMLWVLHPVNVESVAWVTELKNTQSGIFFFSSILCFLNVEEQENCSWYALALVSAAAGMLSKPSTVVLPLCLLLCARWERGGWRRADLRRIAPFFILALGMSALTVIEQRGHILRAGTAEWKLSMPERLIIAGKAVWFYAAKLFWPIPLAFVYPRWAVDAEPLSSWMPLAGLVVVAIFLCVWRRRVWARAGLFGFGFFVAALLPVLGFFDVYYFRYSFVADHFQYIACIGLIALFVGIVSGQADRWHLGRNVRCTLSALLLLALGALTWKQARIYQDMETLWRDTLTKNPQCWMAHNNLGLALVSQGRMQEATQHFERALQIKPDYVEAHNNWGIALLQTGKVKEAMEQAEQALQIEPNSSVAHNNLGLILAEQGRLREAIEHYEQALRSKSDFAAAHYNLGIALNRAGKVQEATEHLSEAVRLTPNNADFHYDLGDALIRQGKVTDALAQYELASQIAPNNAAIQRKLGAVLIVAGKPQEAVGHLKRALRVKPDFAEAQNDLAWALGTLPKAEGGDAGRAVSLAQRACELTGNKSAAYLDTLAVAYAAAGRFDDAVATAQKAIELARSAGQAALAKEIEARLGLYRSGRAYSQPTGVTSHSTPNQSP